MTGFVTGDEGQRFEVRYKDSEDVEHILGWTDKESDAEAMKKGISLHPAFHAPRFIDREMYDEGI